jgi:hypothetical protein
LQLTNALGVANLATGLVNLGVGVYNAYQLREVRKQLGVVEHKIDSLADGQQEIKQSLSDLSSFSVLTAQRVESTLHDHGVALGLLFQSGENMELRLDQLREELRSGFRDMFAGQLASEARSVRRELDARQAAAVRHYKALQSSLASRCQPSARELASVIDAAVELIAWTDAVRHDEDPHAPSRLPMLAIKASGLRMLFDARALESDGAAVVGRERREFLEEVASDAAALASDRCVLEIAIDLREILAGYVYLHRSFGAHVEFGFDRDQGTAIPLLAPELFAWDDGLSVVREAQERANSEARSPQVEVLPDATWLAEWESDYGGAQNLPTQSDVLQALGLPPISTIDEAEGAEVRRLSVRSGRQDLARRLQRVFGLPHLPRLLPGHPGDHR